MSPRRFATGLALLLAACAGPGPRSAGPERPGPPLVTVDGRVIGVDETPPERSLEGGVRLTIRTGPHPVAVDLAPGWYLDEHGLHFSPEDAVRVRGVRGKDGVIRASWIKKGDTQVILRNEQGAPLWKPDATGESK